MTKMTISLSSIHTILKALAENDLSVPVTRAQFIRGNIKSPKQVIRPPWSLPEQDFIDQCDRCSECIAICKTQILEKDDSGFPMANFTKGECTFCGDCAGVCQNGALDKTGSPDIPWMLQIHFASNCLAFNKTVCQACREQCSSGAIIFNVRNGGVSKPLFIDEKCNGCGACSSVCPVNAIEIRQSAYPEQP